MVQEVCYIDVDVWGAQAESCKQYLQKGRPVLVEGRLKFDTWEDANGQTRNKHSIVADRVVFLSSNSGDGGEEMREYDEKEKEVMSQIDQLKNRTAKMAPKAAVKDSVQAPTAETPKKAAKKTATATGEIAFDDAPPFMEELPF